MGSFMNTAQHNVHHISEAGSDYYSDANSQPEPNSNSSPFNSSDSNQELEDKITTLAGQINAAEYRFLIMLAEFDRREAWAGPGIRSCAYWLNWQCGIAMGAAREKVRVARALVGLPEINAAFERGELSFSKVRAMTRVATPENEDYLLMIAHHGTAQHVEKLVGAYRTVSRNEDFIGAEQNRVMGELDESIVVPEVELDQKRDELAFYSRGLSCYQDDDGMWVIKGRLPEESGSLLVKLLRELGDRLVEPQQEQEAGSKENDKDKEIEKDDQKISAETFSGYNKDDKANFSQRRADALVAIAEHFLATADQSHKPSLASLKGAERCQLVVHIGAGACSHNRERQIESQLDGRWLLPDAARRLACDASLLLVERDEVGNVLDIGRKSRIIPAAMARALSIRDGGCCQFPGCCESRYVEGHHIKHWAEGGETKLDNLITLCRHHHRELHKGKFFISVEKNPDNSKPKRFADRLCFSAVEGGFNHGPRHKGIARNPAEFTCACHGFNAFEKSLPITLRQSIDEHTAVTKWAGERMDLGMAVEGLIQAKG
jgi:hypothetical protein